MASGPEPPAEPDLALYRALVAERAGQAAGRRKALGAFATPWPLAQRMVRRAYAGRLGAGRPLPRLLDPACGAGVFLLAAFRELSRLRPDRPATELLRSLHGVDVDPRAVHAARRVLLAAAGEHERARRRRPPACARPATAGRSPTAALPSRPSHSASAALHVHCGDALRDDSPTLFDLVVGNPPWVSLAGKHRSRSRSSAADRRLAARLGGDSYRPNLFELFITATLARLKPGGRQVFLVPDRLARNRQFAGLRRRLAGELRLRWIEFGLAFPGVSADAMAFGVERSVPGPRAVTRLSEDGESVLVPQSSLLEQDGCPFRFVRHPARARLVERLLAWPVRLGDVLTSHTGFIARRGALAPEDGDPAAPATKTDRGSTARRALAPERGHQAALKGTHVRAFAVVGETRLGDAPGARVGGTLDIALLGAREKALVPKTGLDLRAARDRSARWPEQSLYFLLGEARLLAVAVGLLNSRLARMLYEEALVTNRRSLPHIKKLDLDAFPWPRGQAHAREIERAVRTCERGSASLARGSRTPGREGRQGAGTAAAGRGVAARVALDRAVEAAFGLTRAERALLRQEPP